MSEIEKIKEYKLACEANIVSCLWKEPELFFNYDNLRLKDFTYNEWKVFWTIGNELVVKENKPILDEITVGLYLDKHPKLKNKYDQYGGYQTIENAKTYVNIANIEGYIEELQKWNVVLNLAKNKFPIKDRIKDFADMNVQEIYEEFEALINHLFINVDTKIKSYNLCEGLHDLIDKLNEGQSVGLPLYNSPILNREIGGNLIGNITLLGGLSGMGKSNTTIELLLPSIIEFDEKIIIMINEEDETKWQREMIIWTANNIFKEELHKYVLRNGNFNEETMALLRKCADWLEEKKEKKNILIIPFERYSTSLAIKIIKKYASMGAKYFVLDTFKNDSDSQNEQFWLNMQQNMVDIYDTIKPKNKNIHIWITFQLGKNSAKQRYYTIDNIGMAKNIVDTASTCLMLRKVFDDEKKGGKNELKVYRLEGKKNATKIPVELKSDKIYMLIFIVKNRFGSTNEYQVVVENDLSKNTYKEVGITVVPVDW